MQHRGTRLATLCLLLVAGALAGFFIWTSEGSVRRLDEQRESKVATIDRLLSSISTIASAQQAYADYGRRDVASFTRVSLLVDRITTDAAGLRASTESGTSSERLEEFWTALSALMGAESRAREQFAGGDEGAAADTILASAREHVSKLNSSLLAFREAEAGSYRGARTAAAWQSWTAFGAAAALWAVGLLLFAVIPWHAPIPEALPALSAPLERPAEPAIVTVALTPPSINLAAAAAVSTELSQISDQAALQRLLGRAAEILDARGLVIWMGAGTELFAAAAHGYDPSILQRIKPIARNADNATAAAWRTSQLRTVPPDAGGYGAIVVPMLSPAGCVGVLAAEMLGDRERDDARQAVATIFASQLAGVLAAWPAASTTGVQPLDRNAAAS